LKETSRASGATGYLLTQRGWPLSFWRKGKGGEKMKKRITLLIAALMLALSMSFGGVAFAKITPVKENGGGNTPKGQANGVPTVNKNPAGKAPPGQN
jgi:hypothetical protein